MEKPGALMASGFFYAWKPVVSSEVPGVRNSEINTVRTVNRIVSFGIFT